MNKAQEEPQKTAWQYVENKAKPSLADRLCRNMALACALILCISAARNLDLPRGQTLLAAVTEITQPLLDERLGAIDYVGSFFPETVSVFLESPSIRLTAPCSGRMTHAWNGEEPYLSYSAAPDRAVFAALEGLVSAVAHGADEGRIVTIRHKDGIETIYYDLENIFVQEGDAVTEKTCLGTLLAGRDAALEVRRYGRPVRPLVEARGDKGI